MICLGLPIYAYYEIRHHHASWKTQMKGCGWLLGYLLFISVMSYLGSDGFGGQNWIRYPFDFVVIILCSLVFYWWGVNSSVEGEDLELGRRVNAHVDQ